jgi:hypothetical protein
MLGKFSMYTIYSYARNEYTFLEHESWTSILSCSRANMCLNFLFFYFLSFLFLLFIIIYMVITYLNLQNLPNCSIISLLNFTKLTIMFGVEMDF